MNLFYEIKKKDGRTKRRRLAKRDNNNEASVIQSCEVTEEASCVVVKSRTITSGGGFL
ncbi:hypothetical protein YC2023_117771 [Brassica napus]